MGTKLQKKISFVLQFIGNRRFIASSLSNLVNNLHKGVHRIKCKYRYDDLKFEICGTKYKYCNCFLEYIMTFKDDLIEYKCMCCNKTYEYKLTKKLKEKCF